MNLIDTHHLKPVVPAHMDAAWMEAVSAFQQEKRCKHIFTIFRP